MENASKALLMAGGILLAVLILSVFIYVGVTMSNVASQQEESKLLEQVTEFNRAYEAYNRSRLYGADVLSVVNRAIDNNQKYSEDETDYIITITVTIGDSDYTYKDDLSDNDIDLTNYKTSIFTCASVEYNSKTGRISTMSFEQMDI